LKSCRLSRQRFILCPTRRPNTEHVIPSNVTLRAEQIASENMAGIVVVLAFGLDAVERRGSLRPCRRDERSTAVTRHVLGWARRSRTSVV
jgi:hypothetical protein